QFCKETNRPLPAGFASDKPNFPVVNVSIIDAMAYAKWAGKRLPSAKEWEKAARGSEGFAYPWGNERDTSRANVGTEAMERADSRPRAAGPYGVLNLVGNVWELVDELKTPSEQAVKFFGTVMKPAPTSDDTWYTIRGLSFSKDDSPLEAAVWDATTVPSKWKDGNIGFRCVKDAQ